MSGSISNYITSLTDLSEAVRLASPTEAVRLLINLMGYQPPTSGTAETVNALALRVANAASLGFALSESNPISSNEAQTLLSTVIPLYDQLIDDVSDAMMDNTASELKTLKSYLVSFLENLALTRPELQTITFTATLPASVIAYALYRDATRADEIIFENNPIQPLFMPNTIVALSS